MLIHAYLEFFITAALGSPIKKKATELELELITSRLRKYPSITLHIDTLILPTIICFLLRAALP